MWQKTIIIIIVIIVKIIIIVAYVSVILNELPLYIISSTFASRRNTWMSYCCYRQACLCENGWYCAPISPLDSEIFEVV